MKTGKLLGLILGCFTIIVLFSLQGLANPYESYTFDYWGNPVSAPQAYTPLTPLTGLDLGVGSLREPRDIFVDHNHRIYLVDTGNKRLLVFDENWNLEQEIKHEFVTPVNVYVAKNERIYVVDRDQGKIFELDYQGEVLREIGAPKSAVSGVLPSNFNYRPLKVVVDQAGRVYVLADGIYEGFMEFDVDGNFRGFIGAPRVTPKISELFWARFATKAQRSQMALFLPTEYSAVDLDQRGFLYAAEANQIRRLNPTGLDVLRRIGFFYPLGDVPADKDYRTSDQIRSSHFIDIHSRFDGTYSALDRQRGRIFTYDESGNLLYVFGGLGNTLGTFTTPVALTMLHDKFLVVDRTLNRINVFEPTEYANLIHQAIFYYQEGEYDHSAEVWRQVLQSNVNLDMAYSGIGAAFLRQKDYQAAMANFKLGNNRKDYSTAFGLYRREVLGANFGLVVGIVLAILAAIFYAYRAGVFAKFYSFILAKEAYTSTDGPVRPKRLGKETIRSMGYSLYVIFHPFDGFWDLKHEKRGNLPAALGLLSLVTMTYVFMRQYTGFAFNPRDLSKLNIMQEVLSVVIPFLLWAGVNWALTTLMDGKGTFRDIVITTAFGLTPIILVNIPMTIISNYITLPEGAFYYFFVALAGIWALGLVFLGTMVIHDYDMTKNFGATGLTIVGMGTVLFISLLVFSVVNLMAGFLTSVYLELMLRL